MSLLGDAATRLLEPANLPQAFGIVLMLALGGLLLRLNPGSRVHLALAAHFILRAGLNTFGSYTAVPTEWDRVAYRTWPYMHAPVLAATVWFALEYRAKYGGRPASRAWPWGLLVATVAVDVAYAWNHALYDSSRASLGTHDWWNATEGPLFLVSTARNVSYAVVAWVLARDAVGMRDGPARRSTVIVAFALALLPAFYAAQQFGWLFASFPSMGLGVFLPERSIWWQVGWYAIALTIAPAALTVRALRPLLGGARRRATGLFALAVAWGLASGANVAVLYDPLFIVTIVGDGIFTAAVAVAAAYALMRHQLFDLDLKIKWTIKQSTVAAAFVGVFFVVSEAAQTFFQSTAGPYIGIAAAGTLVFALAPLQRVAERVATAAVPHARPTTALSQDERAALYRDQVALAWADGSIDLNERRLLNQLRDRLGLAIEEAGRIEHEAAPA